MKRILEPEAIDTINEAFAYDKIVKIHNFWLNRPQIKDVLRLIKTERNIFLLDIGCGTARISIGIAQRKPDVKIYAVDISFNMLKVATKNINYNQLGDNIFLLQADAKLLPFKDKSFDVVICSSLLHHLKAPVFILNEINRVIKDKGIILIRDLIRPASRFILNLFVWVFGLPYNKLMKKEYRDSLCAAFTIKEYKEMLACSDIKEAKISKNFPHFIKIIKKCGKI